MHFSLASLRKPFVTALCALLLATQSFATWSIIVVNTRTQEIIVASATCVEAINLRAVLAMLEAQAGGGCAQSIGATIAMRQDASEMFALGVPPEEILQVLSTYDNLHELRQYGFVDMAGRAATFTGTQCGDWAGGLTGTSGDLVYSIQGNVLTGQPVVDAAEQALLNTPGDMAQRVMAAMEAARDMGGDGRCSCSNSAPTSCGAPPASFTKSAHVGFLISARPGDDPYCDNFACAKGDLYLAINKASLTAADPDPVSEMRIKFDSLRLALSGRPDAYLSSVHSYSNKVIVGSTTPQTFVLDLSDVDGNLLTSGGATISLEHTARSAGLSTLHQVVDHNDGTYTVEVMPGTTPGVDELLFVIDDGIRPVTLWPPTSLDHSQPLSPLSAEEQLDGLNNIDVFSARLTEDGLKAWVICNQGAGAGTEFIEYTRPDWQTPFSAATTLNIANFPLANLKSFWISQDGLRMTLAAQRQGRLDIDLFSTYRTTTNDDFMQPVTDLDLNTNDVESAPFLSANELEIWFHSSRGNSNSLWYATRLSKDARWYPPVRYQVLTNSEHNGYPMFANGGSDLIFASRLPASSGYSLRQASRDSGGNIAQHQLLPGVAPSRSGARIPISFIVDPSSGRRSLCTLTGTEIMHSPLVDGSLNVTPNAVSLSSSGTFNFSLTADLAFAGGTFDLYAGDGLSSPTSIGVLPISFNRHFSRHLRSNLTTSSGTLSSTAQATSSWSISSASNIPPQLIDRNISFCYIANNGADNFISQSVVVKIVP
jgi:hypothetical protein